MEKNTKPQLGVECGYCKQRLFSESRHDFKNCACVNQASVDGGKDYLRFGWVFEKPLVVSFDPKLDSLPATPSSKTKRPKSSNAGRRNAKTK